MGKAHGTVAELKSRFSQGYKLSTSVKAKKAEEANEFIMEIAKGKATLLNTLATVRNYEVSRSLSFDKLYSTLTKSSQDSSQVSSQDSFQDSSQELTEGSGYDFNDTGY